MTGHLKLLPSVKACRNDIRLKNKNYHTIWSAINDNVLIQFLSAN